MKIALIGATGNIGSSILTEALSRGHQVTAIARTPEKLPLHERLVAQLGDILDESGLVGLVEGHDAVVSAYNPGWANANLGPEQVQGSKNAFTAAKKAGVRRVLSVGGAGSLEVAPGIRLHDTPTFPEAYRTPALAQSEVLSFAQKENELDWTILSPAAEIQPGNRTGKFRIGKDLLLTDADGRSRISTQDFAVALVDELERPAHSRSRFTVAY